MKTVSGEVFSTKSVSLSQAARTIAAFVSADNGGASQAVATYLKRTSASFNELVQFHKDHKTPNFKIKKSREAGDSNRVREEGLENGGEKKKRKYEPVNVEGDGGRKKEKVKKEEVEDLERGSTGNLGKVKKVIGGEGDRKIRVGDGEGKKYKEKMKIEAGLGNAEKADDFERKKEKKKKKSGGGERASEGDFGNVKNVVGSEEDRKVSDGGGEGQKGEKTKKIEAGLGNFKKVDDFERKKEKKKNKSGGGEKGSEDNLRIEEKGKEKKRKSEEIVEGEIGNSSEQSGHKKKKRRKANADD